MGVLINEMFGKFTQVPNIVISDTNIKHTAFRQYCYLASKPSGWKIRNTDISNNIGISESTIADNFTNLIKCNYIRRYPCKDKNGKFIGGYNYHIFVVPTESIKNTDSENTSFQKNPDYINTKSKESTTISNMEILKIMYNVQEEKKKKPRGYTQKPRTTKQTPNNTA